VGIEGRDTFQFIPSYSPVSSLTHATQATRGFQPSFGPCIACANLALRKAGNRA